MVRALLGDAEVRFCRGSVDELDRVEGRLPNQYSIRLKPSRGLYFAKYYGGSSLKKMKKKIRFGSENVKGKKEKNVHQKQDEMPENRVF